MLILGRFLERTSVGSKSLNLALLRPKLPPEIFTPQVWVRYIYISVGGNTKMWFNGNDMSLQSYCKTRKQPNFKLHR